MKLKMIALLGALLVAAPVVAEAAPAGGLTASQFSTMAAPVAESNAAVLPGETAKIDKVWYRRGWGWRGGGWRGGWGWRRGWGWRGYGWRRPFWRRRWYY